MDQAYALGYRELYHRHWWWRAREEEILSQLDKRFGSASNKEILDVGCGDGLFFGKLQKFGKVTGVEADPDTMTPDGPWRGAIYCQRFDTSFQPERRYDAILMLDILEHLPDPAGALSHASTLLRSDGFLLATVPAFNQLWTSHDDINHHEIRYTRRSFLPLVRSSGFVPAHVRYLYHWTCPVKLMIRLKEKLFGAKLESPKVPPEWLNQVCYGLSRLEQFTVSRLPMPFGSSLLVIAEKQSMAS